jgi:para-nitrobenzyl esterase
MNTLAEGTKALPRILMDSLQGRVLAIVRRTRRWPWNVLVAAICLNAVLPSLPMNDRVRTEGGLLAGATTANGVHVYKGIPYAAPPIGYLRWRPPQPPSSWTGVRQATSFSPICEQMPGTPSSIYFQPPQPRSEDCLYLNVWTPANSPNDHLPVMVWIHGGGLTSGNASTPIYNAEALAKEGVVVVTFNYRLGVFGFFAHPKLSDESVHRVSGNYGVLDQIAALRWVHENISAFGGDPRLVTIFGESAGSWSVNYLMVTPLATGLFQRAIGESGAAFGWFMRGNGLTSDLMKKRADAEGLGARLAASQGAGTLAALRSLPAEDLLKASDPKNPKNWGNFVPNLDGWVFPNDAYVTFASGKQNDVPLITGSTADEGSTLCPWPTKGTASTFVEQMQSRFGGMVAQFFKLYPASSDEEAQRSSYANCRDADMGWEARTWARLQARTGRSKSYLYYFTRVPPGLGSAHYGAFHGAEIGYVFHNGQVFHYGLPLHPWEATDWKLSEELSSYWVNFARTGDPNGKDLPKWPAYDEKNEQVMELGDTVKVRGLPNKAAQDFLDRYFASLRRGTE